MEGAEHKITSTHTFLGEKGIDNYITITSDKEEKTYEVMLNLNEVKKINELMNFFKEKDVEIHLKNQWDMDINKIIV